MPVIPIQSLTSHDLLAGKYATEFPDFYALKQSVELNAWHQHQSVFDHTVAVYEQVELELTFAFLEPTSIPIAQSYFAEKVGNYTRAETLRAATLFHDMAKSMTLIRTASGETSCPGHEHAAVTLVKKYQPVFGFDQAAQAHIERIVLHHGFVSQIIELILSQPTRETELWSLFTAAVGDVAYELLFFIRADLWGADLKLTHPDQHASRDQVMIKLANACLPRES